MFKNHPICLIWNLNHNITKWDFLGDFQTLLCDGLKTDANGPEMSNEVKTNWHEKKGFRKKAKMKADLLHNSEWMDLIWL